MSVQTITLRQFLVAAWGGESILTNQELTATGTEVDYDEPIEFAFRHLENSNEYSYLVIAGDSAVLSAPSNLFTVSVDDLTLPAITENEGYEDFEPCPVAELPGARS